MSNVVHLASNTRVEEAWDAYCAAVERRDEEPKNLKLNMEMARAWQRWSKLFLLSERG
jgi:hypothetical protein